MSWDYELAKAIMQSRCGKSPAPVILEGTVVSTTPLKLSFWDGEIMAPPLKLDSVVAAQGFYRDRQNGHLLLEQWKTGDKTVCCLMDQTVVILGRLGGTAWTIPTK